MRAIPFAVAVLLLGTIALSAEADDVPLMRIDWAEAEANGSLQAGVLGEHDATVGGRTLRVSNDDGRKKLTHVITIDNPALKTLRWRVTGKIRYRDVRGEGYLELLNVLLLVSLDPRDAKERGLLLTASRWITVIVIFHTGFQKLLYGTYFEGQFLAYMIATRNSFGDAFKLVLPAEEFSRLIHSHPRRFGAGPFSVDSPLFLLVSNSVYVFELLAPVFLLIRRTRTVATLAVIGFMLLVQSGARELFFGSVLVNLLLLFLPRATNHRLLPVFATFYALLLSAHFWWAPELEIH